MGLGGKLKGGQAVVDILGTQRQQEPGVSLNPTLASHSTGEEPNNEQGPWPGTGRVQGVQGVQGAQGVQGLSVEGAMDIPRHGCLAGARRPMRKLGYRRGRPESESSTLRGDMSRNAR